MSIQSAVAESHSVNDLWAEILDGQIELEQLE